MNGTTNDGCDSYKFKVPITVDPNNDIGDDVALAGRDLEFGISSGDQFCAGGFVDFVVDILHSSLVIKKTSGEDTVTFHGMTAAATASKLAMVPVKLLIQVHRHTGKGFVMLSGLGDLTPLHGNTSAFVGLSLTEDDLDGDTDMGCTSVTLKNTNQN